MACFAEYYELQDVNNAVFNHNQILHRNAPVAGYVIHKLCH